MIFARKFAIGLFDLASVASRATPITL